jgi:transposase
MATPGADAAHLARVAHEEAIRISPDDAQPGGCAQFELMVDLISLRTEDLQRLSPSDVAELAGRMLAQLKASAERARRDEQTIRFKDAKIEKITFELARLKNWKFGARTERMSAEQRQIFEETTAEDEADLEAQLRALNDQQHAKAASASSPPKRGPRREKLPEHLRRVEHRHEPQNTTCECGQPLRRVGEDVSERLDVVPAEFFVHRHIRGKWACRCCQTLVQEPVDPQIIDKGMPTAGLVAHTLVGHFVDHLPYYRLEQINARSGVHTPRSTLASWSGAGGAALVPLFDAHRDFVLGARVLHADETPVRMLDPGARKTRQVYVWA